MRESLEEFLENAHTTPTTETYLRHINKFKLRVENHQESSYKDILKYMESYKVNQVGLASLKRYFDYLLEKGMRDNHPCRNIRILKNRKPIQHQDLFTSEELNILLKRENRYRDIEMRNKVILGLLIYQGLTIENICKLRKEDVDFDMGTVYVRATNKVHRRTLTLKARQIPVIYTYYQSLKKDREHLFYNKLNSKISKDVVVTILKPMQNLFPNKTLNATKIRQSVISNWLNEEKLSLEDVQLLSGQKWLSTTEKYISGAREDKREKINRFFPL